MHNPNNQVKYEYISEQSSCEKCRIEHDNQNHSQEIERVNRDKIKKLREKRRKIQMVNSYYKKILTLKALKKNTRIRKRKRIYMRQKMLKNKRSKKHSQRIKTPQTLVFLDKQNNEVRGQFQVFLDKQVYKSHVFTEDCKNVNQVDNDVASSWTQVNQGIYHLMKNNVQKTLTNHANDYIKKFDPSRAFHDCLFKLIHNSCIEYANQYFRNFQLDKNIQTEVRKLAKNAIQEVMKKYYQQFELVDAEELALFGNNFTKNIQVRDKTKKRK